MSSSIRMAGDDVIELMIDDRANRADLAARLQGSEDWLEVVAAADRIAVQVDVSKMSLKDARSRLQDAADQVIQMGRETIYEPLIIPVCYGGAFGPDLALISKQAGMSQNAIIDMHSKGSHVVDHIGFTPGFGYLDSPGVDMSLSRLATPRQSIPAGSIGVLTGRTGLYALAGPGGWPIIGRTPAKLFDALAVPPTQLHPGRPIEFCAIDHARFQQLKAP